MASDGKWTAEEIPDQTGRTALVTGANSGLGLRTSEALAAAGARVLMACRDSSKGAEALGRVSARAEGADPELVELDLADLGSVERAAAAIAGRGEPLDLLINNAGVMAPPRRETADGFELQLGTNHFGHFALTGRLLPRLEQAGSPRVVTVSSMAHRQGSMDFDDLNWEGGYSRWPAYGRSKLANLLFTFELDRRLRARGSNLIAVAAHPGYSATNLQSSGPGQGLSGLLLRPLGWAANLVLAQSDEMGALPSLYAATEPGIEGSSYVGPDGPAQARGHPKLVGCSSEARDTGDAERLWDLSVELTGVDPGI